MINIKVKCFSQVKYALGVDVLTFQLDDNTTSIDLEKIIRKKAGKKLNNVSLRIAINQKYQKEEIALQDGDEVVFIPPVQGG
jgi:molybdopterin converting factor small subunit